MNARTPDPFLAIDRAHELAEEEEAAFSEELTKETHRQDAAMRQRALTGNWQTLTGLAESLALRLGQRGGTENLIRTALSCGSTAAGEQLLKMISECIAEDAETAALGEMEQAERQRAGGLACGAAA